MEHRAPDPVTLPPRAVSFRLDWAGETEEGMGAYASWLTARDWAMHLEPGEWDHRNREGQWP